MKETNKRIKRKTFYYKKIFISLLIVALFVFKPALALAGADGLTFDERNVMSDLESATVNGEKITLETHGYVSGKKAEVLTLGEYGYSEADKFDDYGLYVYVYNPSNTEFVLDSPLNKLQLAVGKDSTAQYKKYALTFLNASEQEGYANLYLKFKLKLSEYEKKQLLSKLDKTERVYKVSGIELLTKGDLNSTEYVVADEYRYSGYANGYGANSGSTLTCNVKDSDVLTLDVHQTYYRPEGTNGKNDYTQDSLHSVYFAVPNDVLARYGDMTAIHAEWLNAVLAPALVTGNQDAYDAVVDMLGVNVKDSDSDYYYFGGVTKEEGALGTYTSCGYTYYPSWLEDDIRNDKYGVDIETLYMLFYANDADNYIVSAEDIKGRLISGKVFGGELVNGKYSKKMFSAVDVNFTEVNIQADEELSLTSEIISKDFWDKLLGLEGDVNTQTFDGIKAIQEVKADNFSGSDEENAKNLYISESDYADFEAFYNANKENNTVFLFRYQVSDYISQEATIYKRIFGGEFLSASEIIGTNAYFFQQTVNLDFDIIDVTFTGDAMHVIPVVSNPQDIIHDGTPPVYTTKDRDYRWLIIAGLIVLGCVVGISIYGGVEKERK